MNILKKVMEINTFASTGKDKEVLTKYIELWNKMKNLIQKINGKPCKYKKEFMKIKFESGDNLPLNKTLKLNRLTTIVGSVFQELKKYYLQIYLHECSYEL